MTKENINSNPEKSFFVQKPPPKGKKNRVLIFGTFDIIHPAHLKFFIEARQVVNCTNCELVVVIARDSSIKRIKGHNPIFNEDDRLRLISGLRLIDYAQLGNEGENQFEIIKEINPDSIVLGYDQLPNDKSLIEFLKINKLSVNVFRLPHFESGDLSSSSEVRDKVLEIYYEKNNKKATFE
ncbi:MAG: FAD synthase [Asgard group archaeon]|nr:FAD synthase [Asgard group archaeon]